MIKSMLPATRRVFCSGQLISFASFVNSKEITLVKIRLFFLLLIFTLTSLTFAQDTTNLTQECVSDYDPKVDYFPEKAEIEYAEGFSVEYFNNYKVVTVSAPDTPDTEEAL